MLCSGDIGYCHLKERTIGIVLTWDDDDNVVNIDCKHETCGFSHSCELYQRRPVGFHQTYPKKE